MHLKLATLKKMRLYVQQKQTKKPEKPYVPHLGFTYPDVLDAHMIPPKKEIDLVIDENYPFLDKSFGFRFKSALLYLGIFVIVFFISPIRFGLRIEGRNILKKYRKLLRGGALTVANHVHRWDFLIILQAIRYRRSYFPAWPENLTGSDRTLIRLVGGIPIPRDIHTMRYFNRAFEELHNKRKWLHAFPEGSNWHYFQPIRPFKKGMFTLAYQYNIPVIPMAFSYRESRGIYKIFKKNYPLITLRIGEPILPDLSKPRREAATLLREQTHRKIVELAGITDNPYPCDGD